MKMSDCVGCSIHWNLFLAGSMARSNKRCLEKCGLLTTVSVFSLSNRAVVYARFFPEHLSTTHQCNNPFIFTSVTHSSNQSPFTYHLSLLMRASYILFGYSHLDENAAHGVHGLPGPYSVWPWRLTQHLHIQTGGIPKVSCPSCKQAYDLLRD